METEGLLSPANRAEVREHYAAVEGAAEVTATAVAKALDVDATDYRERVDEDVVLTAHEAIFASLLSVHVGTREEFDEWLAGRERTVTTLGSENVSGVVWHDAPIEGTVLAATCENEPEAAAHALRRQAFARLYREVV